MTKRLISFFLALCLLAAIPLSARYRYNPYTTKLDYYEAAGDITLGDVGDITLTGLANGDILYYNGAAWVNLAAGGAATVLTIAGGIPSWQAAGAPAAHAASHLAPGGADQVDHDQLLNFVAAEHLSLPNTIAAVLTDHNKAAHDALNIDADTVDGEHAAAIVTNARVKAHFPDTIANVLSDHNLAAHTALGLFDQSSDVDHNATTNYAANQHVVLPNTIANVLSDHNLAAHTALGLFDASGDVDHNLTTNYVANQHINWTAAASDFSTSEDFFLAWTEAADHAAITQTAVAGVATVPLINIDDDRTGVTADTVGEATIVMNAAGTYAFYVQTGAVQFDAAFEVLNVFSYDYTTDHNLLVGYLAGQDLTAGQGTYNTLLGELAGADITTGDYNIVIGYAAGRLLTTNNDNILIGSGIASVAASQAHSNVIIGRTAAIELTNGYENIIIGKEAARDLKSAGLNIIIGWQASLEHESGNYNTIVGTQAGYGVAGLSNYEKNTFIGMQAGELARTAAVRNVVIGYEAAEDLSTGADNIVIGHMAGEGWLDTESEKLVIDVTDTTTPLIYGDFSADNISINGDLSVLMDAALDQILLQQSAVAGTEDQPLINIDDDRTGATASELSEATIYIDAEGTYAMFINDGNVSFGSTCDVQFNAGAYHYDNKYIVYGLNSDMATGWIGNGAGDDLWILINKKLAATDTAALFYNRDRVPSGMTDHDDYLSPTFVIANDEGADTNDYAGVVIGERTQADVKVAHYFDFYAMTGATDGSVDPANAEVAAIFRFGPNGSATPGYATTPGDILFEGSLEVDGSKQVAGYNRYDYISWNDCFDHGSTVAKYDQDWETAALNTQGNGTNTIQTNPSHITLTTDNNAIGDNEGTRTDYQIIERARLNRTEFGCTLGQTANTQYYMGWNTSGTNAMVPAADEYVIVFFDVSDNANWQIKVGDGATEDVFTSAIAGAATFIRHEIWVESDGTVHWAVNGTELDITGSVDNLMTASDHYLIVGQAQSVTGAVTGAAAIVAEICYVENEKTKIN